MTAPMRPWLLPDLPVVLVSHRGPVSFHRDQTGARTASRGAGGLVTALTGLASSLPDAVWVCAATTNEGGQLVRRAWTSYRWDSRPRRRHDHLLAQAMSCV